MSGLMSIGGLVSGLNIDDIMAKLQQVANIPVTQLQSRRATLDAKFKAWGDANTRILAVKEKATALIRLSDLMEKTATSSEASVLATAGGTAAEGDYTFTVQSVATYHQLTSQSYTDQDVTRMGTGSLTIGSNDKSATIDASGMTLAELRDAINRSDSGVKATIVSDGSGASYRLVLTSQSQGTAGAIQVSSTLAGGTAPVLVDLQAAQDTTLLFGSGANAFTVTRSSTKITDIIPGVTLNMKGDAVGKTVTVNVTSSTDKMKAAIRDFVDQYNALLDFVKQQDSFNKDTGKSGTLFGEYKLHQVVGDLASAVGSQFPGLPAAVNALAKLGITSDATGKLLVDDTKLDAALAGNLQDVGRLFGPVTTATSSAVSYVYSTSDTKVSGSGGYAIVVTQPAVQASLTIGAPLPASLAQDETLTLNGETIALTAGMTSSDIVAAINAKLSAIGFVATLTGAHGTSTGDYLTLTRAAYGSAYHIDVVSDTGFPGGTGIGTAALSETAPGAGNTGIVGQDIAGTINGRAATGKGQLLTSTAGDSEGLQVRVNATAAGDYGTLTFSKGIGMLVSEKLGFVTDPVSGTIRTTQNGLQSMMDQLDTEIERTSDSVQREMDRTRVKFNSMEVALGKLQNLSGQLASLIAQLPKE